MIEILSKIKNYKPLIDIEVNIEPPISTSQGSKRILYNRKDNRMFIGHTSDSKASRVRKQLSGILSKHVPEEPIVGAAILYIEYVYTHKKGTAKKNIEKKMPKITKPDNDNNIKIIQDCLERLGYIKNDSRFYITIVGKFYYKEPSIKIKIFTEGE